MNKLANPQIKKIRHFLFVLLVVLFHFSFTSTGEESQLAKGKQDTFDWRSDWAVKDNFSISIDTQGYNFPTAIAFVPNPGEGPKDPLYFVTELRGKVKVVTNDRTVYTFAEDFFKLNPKEELPEVAGEVGMAGICLEPENGYVFVTFAYQDAGNNLRNNIVRFKSDPITFSLKPESQVAFTEVFSSYQSSESHQIGHCQVSDNLLYVSVGDGRVAKQSQNIDSLLGKIIRMTLDGKPVLNNPFYTDDNIKKATNYVWAYGFRNPFGLRIVEGRVFVAENGIKVDRFLEVHKGENYLWDGTDWSIGSNAAAVFGPAVSPVQLDYLSNESTNFPKKYRNKFYLALSGSPKNKPGPGLHGEKSVINLEYGFKQARMLSVPDHFLIYRGKGNQLIVGLGFGPDGLYFVPMLANRNGTSAIFKISYDPDKPHPYNLRNEEDAKFLMSKYSCWDCHDERKKLIGPPLGSKILVRRVQDKLNSEEYITLLKNMNEHEKEKNEIHRQARKEIISTQGLNRVRTWVKYKLLEPKIDNTYPNMPDLGLTEGEAQKIADYLVPAHIIESSGFKIGDLFTLDPYRKLGKKLIPEIKIVHLLLSFAVGCFFTFFLVGVVKLLR